MSENNELWGEPVMGDVYAVRTFNAEDGKLVSVTHGGAHWVDGVCEAVCLMNPAHAAPVEGCTCGVYAWWTVDKLVDEYDAARLIVAVIRMEGNVIEAENGVKAGKAQIVAWWVAEPEDAAEARIIAELIEACEASAPNTRRYFVQDVMTGRYPPPTTEGRD